MSIPIGVKKKCIELQSQGLTSREVYTQYFSSIFDTKYSGFRVMLQKWKKKIQADDTILETANLGYGFIAHDATVQIGKDGTITQSWVKSKASDSLYLELIESIKKLPLLNMTIERTKGISEYMLEIPLYDMHWGICDAEYYKTTLEEVLEIMLTKVYTEIYIPIGSDLFHNDDFRGRTSSGREIQKIDMVKAWNEARDFYYKIITMAMIQSEKVTVVYIQGNHDESMSWAFTQMIKAEFGTNIIVDDELKDRKCITYGTNFIGLTHGDKVRGKPINLRSIYTIEFPIEFANSKVREIHAGHLHHEKQEDTYGVMCRTLSSGNETDSWHYDNGYVGAHKRFTVFEWNEEKLKSIYYV